MTNIFAKYMGKEICGYAASFTEELGSISETLSERGYNEGTTRAHSEGISRLPRVLSVDSVSLCFLFARGRVLFYCRLWHKKIKQHF